VVSGVSTEVAGSELHGSAEYSAAVLRLADDRGLITLAGGLIIAYDFIMLYIKENRRINMEKKEIKEQLEICKESMGSP